MRVLQPDAWQNKIIAVGYCDKNVEFVPSFKVWTVPFLWCPTNVRLRCTSPHVNGLLCWYLRCYGYCGVGQRACHHLLSNGITSVHDMGDISLGTPMWNSVRIPYLLVTSHGSTNRYAERIEKNVASDVDKLSYVRYKLPPDIRCPESLNCFQGWLYPRMALAVRLLLATDQQQLIV